MNTFATHPSVRIRGTENNYEPVQCLSSQCINKAPHMHCPFCTKNDVFVDPVILKAHYRVKHVDKGIEFAGLKILRCCDHCDIVGTIKGVKEFKGAHWHCYKCKNGFNRRDEAIKHYRTHFRNPQTTFQIQITQEINQSYQVGHEVEAATDTLTQDDFSTIHPALTEAVMSTSATDAMLTNHQPDSTLANGKTTENDVHVSVAANETVGTSEGQTIMIIQQEPLESGQDSAGGDNTTTFQITNIEGDMQFSSIPDKVDLEHQVYELEQKNAQLEMEKRQLEQDLRAEIHQLKIQVQVQSTELTAYQKREQDLLSQLSIPLDERIHELLVQLKADHEDLLHQQLAQLRRVYLAQLPQVESSISGQTSGERLTITSVANTESSGQTTDLTTSATQLVIVTHDGSSSEVTLENGVHIENTAVKTDDISTSCDDVTTNIVTTSHDEFVPENTQVTLSQGDLENLQTAGDQEETHIVISQEEPPSKRKRDDT